MKVKGATSRIKDAISRLKDAISRLKGVTSRIKGATLRIKGATSRIKGATSRIKGQPIALLTRQLVLKGAIFEFRDGMVKVESKSLAICQRGVMTDHTLKLSKMLIHQRLSQ